MRDWHGWLLLGVLCAGVIGCGGGGDNPATTADSQPPGDQEGSGGTAVATAKPEAAVFEFLEAVRTGDDETTAKMLTHRARTKTTERNMEVAPPGSDTARFEVGAVEYVDQDGARVSSTWTDQDANGKPRSDDIVWMVRREPEGWRIAGMAATVFPGEPPLLLNFEDPDDMIRKQQMLREEIQRRSQKPSQQARQPENSAEAIRR